MARLTFIIIFITNLFLLTACNSIPPKKITTKDWDKATNQVVKQYAPITDKSLKPEFKKAHVHYPPKEMALLTFKEEQEMEFWAKDDPEDDWKLIKTYELTAYSGEAGPKLKYHDDQIPEGIYHVVMLNPFSALQLSMRINYPNEYDKKWGEIEGRDNLGGDIFIHGRDLSVGCIAIGDEAIDELFVLAARIGPQNVKVIIAPNDLREDKPVTDLEHCPKWVPELYDNIEEELKPFKFKE